MPTEEEWEYACRGGGSSREDCAFNFYLDRPTSDLASDQANFNGNFPAGKARRGVFLQRTAKVGSYPSNRLGLCDLHGNVWEWTASTWGPGRVQRGGDWGDAASHCRAANRRRDDRPSYRSFNIGVRLAFSPPGADGR